MHDYPDYNLHNAKQQIEILLHHAAKMRPVFNAAMELYEEYKANNLYISVGNYGFPKKFIDACRVAEEEEKRRYREA